MLQILRLSDTMSFRKMDIRYKPTGMTQSKCRKHRITYDLFCHSNPLSREGEGGGVDLLIEYVCQIKHHSAFLYPTACFFSFFFCCCCFDRVQRFERQNSLESLSSQFGIRAKSSDILIFRRSEYANDHRKVECVTITV